MPTTVGIVAKNPPLAAPFIITKTTTGPSESETGQIANMLTVVRNKPMKSVFRGPRASAARPKPSRPTADEMLKPATRPAPALEERPREALYRGMKKGGTRSGKVAMTPTRNIAVNLKSRKRFLWRWSASDVSCEEGSRCGPFDEG